MPGDAYHGVVAQHRHPIGDPVHRGRGPRGGDRGRGLVGADHTDLRARLRQRDGQYAGATTEVDGVAGVRLHPAHMVEQESGADIQARPGEGGTVRDDLESHLVELLAHRKRKAANGFGIACQQDPRLLPTATGPHRPERFGEHVVHGRGQVLVAGAA